MKRVRSALKRNLPIFLIAVASLLCAAVLHSYLKTEKRRLFVQHFSSDAEHRLWTFQRRVENVVAELKVAQFYFLSSEFIRRDEFSSYAKRIFREHPDMRLLFWLPRISKHERSSYETTVRLGGDAAFMIRETLPDGSHGPSGEKDVYYPAHYIEPFRNYRQLLGIDFFSMPEVNQTIRQAIGSIEVAASGPLSIPAGGGKGPDILAAIAVRSQNRMILPSEPPIEKGIAGVLVTSLHAERIAKSSVAVAPDLLMHIEDKTDDGSPIPIYSEWNEETKRKQRLHEKAGAHRTYNMVIGGRDWAVSFVPSQAYINRYRTYAPEIAFFLMLLAGGFLCFYLKQRLDHQRSIEETVAERTHDLTGLQKEQEANIHRLEDEIRKRLRIEADLRASEQMLEQLILRDPLTNLLNRRGFQQALRIEGARMQREDSPLFSILIDVDDFKYFNDRYSHAVGDGVLVQISEGLKKNIRQADYAARIGGDEFLLLLPDTRLAEAWNVAEKIRLSVSTMQVSLATGTLKVTVSIGLTEIHPEMVSIDQILAKTHGALAESKRLGKNRVSVGAGMQQTPFFFEELQEAKSYRVVKQGIHTLDDDHTTGWEYLTRSCIKSFEMPEDFFRICRENNWLTAADLCCLRQCMRSAGRAAKDHWKHINIYPSTLLELDPGDILALWEANGMPRGVCLEISEELIIGDPSNIVSSVRALQNAGLHIGLDDVGFGRSCLESLVLLEPDVVKIDKRLIRGITSDTRQVRNLERLLRLLENIGAMVVCEGIETAEERDVLRSLNVRYGQGYFWEKPQSDE
jgi:diguanylate cyclase (GGDEF)-like protein